MVNWLSWCFFFLCPNDLNKNNAMHLTILIILFSSGNGLSRTSWPPAYFEVLSYFRNENIKYYLLICVWPYQAKFSKISCERTLLRDGFCHCKEIERHPHQSRWKREIKIWKVVNWIQDLWFILNKAYHTKCW